MMEGQHLFLYHQGSVDCNLWCVKSSFPYQAGNETSLRSAAWKKVLFSTNSMTTWTWFLQNTVNTSSLLVTMKAGETYLWRVCLRLCWSWSWPNSHCFLSPFCSCFSMEGGELFQRIQEKQAFTERGRQQIFSSSPRHSETGSLQFDCLNCSSVCHTTDMNNIVSWHSIYFHVFCQIHVYCALRDPPLLYLH